MPGAIPKSPAATTSLLAAGDRCPRTTASRYPRSDRAAGHRGQYTRGFPSKFRSCWPVHPLSHRPGFAVSAVWLSCRTLLKRSFQPRKKLNYGQTTQISDFFGPNVDYRQSAGWHAAVGGLSRRPKIVIHNSLSQGRSAHHVDIWPAMLKTSRTGQLRGGLPFWDEKP